MLLPHLALAQLQLGIKTADLAAAFDRIDVSGDMELELEEFIAAFKPSGITYPYDLEDALMQVPRVWQHRCRGPCVFSPRPQPLSGSPEWCLEGHTEP